MKENVQRNFPVEGGGIIPVIITYWNFFGDDARERVYPHRMCVKCGRTRPFMDFLWVPGIQYPTDEKIPEETQVISMHDTCCFRHCGKEGLPEQAHIKIPGKGKKLHLRFDLTQETGIRYTWIDPKDHCRYAWLKRGTRYNNKVPDIRFQPYMKR